MRTIVTFLLLGWAVAACETGGDSAGATGTRPPRTEPPPAADEPPEPDASGPAERALLSHTFGLRRLAPFEETQPCVAWTLQNEAPLYVERVQLRNGGSFHHSNWFVVPEDLYEGPDGYFDCDERGFDELGSAASGTVIFAQSTQSIYEEQRLGEGVVIKIPPRHKLVAGTHLLNLSDQEVETELRVTLEVIHPAKVKTIVAPFRLTYHDLHIPPRAESRFLAECDLSAAYESAGFSPFDMKLYWVLPHTHSMATHFDVQIVGGPRDGESIVAKTAFDGDAAGRAFDPPIDLSPARGLRMTCGYLNTRDEEVGWGVGDQEMCEMLGFADSQVLIDAAVRADGAPTDPLGAIQQFTGPCTFLTVPKNEAQSDPTDEEKAGELVIPAQEEDPTPFLGPPACQDAPTNTAPAFEPTLEKLRAGLFLPSCSYNACHGGATPAAGLDLTAADLHAELLSHEVQDPPGLSLVAPGDPAGSWLHRKVAECAPEGRTHMPLNSPELLRPGLVAALREWIAAGALR